MHNDSFKSCPNGFRRAIAYCVYGSGFNLEYYEKLITTTTTTIVTIMIVNNKNVSKNKKINLA